MTPGTETWASVEWRAGALSWIDEQLAGAGITRTGEVEQPHLRPWATLLTAPTTHGPVWLKATGSGTAFEVGLYELLNRVVPEHVLTPIATDVARGWLLLPDGGPLLADRVDGDGLVDALVAILPRYGQLQRDLAPEADSLVALGVSDMRAAAMPMRFDQALDAAGRYIDGIDGKATRAQVVACAEDFRSWCDQLATMPGPASLDHNDLHPWNMFVTRLDPVEEVTFYDWGDAVVAHPFACMLVPLGWVQRRLSVGAYDPQILRIRDAYLEVFGDMAPHAGLVEALELACRVGKVARALTWDRALEASPADELDEDYASAPLDCLRSLLDDSYLGGA